METPKAVDTARAEMTLISKSVVIKGELSCSEDLVYRRPGRRHHQPEGNRLTIGPNGRVKANVNARAVIVVRKLEGNIHARRPGRSKAVGHCHGQHGDPAHLALR